MARREPRPCEDPLSRGEGRGRPCPEAGEGPAVRLCMARGLQLGCDRDVPCASASGPPRRGCAAMRMEAVGGLGLAVKQSERGLRRQTGDPFGRSYRTRHQLPVLAPVRARARFAIERRSEPTSEPRTSGWASEQHRASRKPRPRQLIDVCSRSRRTRVPQRVADEAKGLSSPQDSRGVLI
jgi:hypothetical protein